MEQTVVAAEQRGAAMSIAGDLELLRELRADPSFEAVQRAVNSHVKAASGTPEQYAWYKLWWLLCHATSTTNTEPER
jgi:hypothetical protein